MYDNLFTRICQLSLHLFSFPDGPIPGTDTRTPDSLKTRYFLLDHSLKPAWALEMLFAHNHMLSR